MQLMLNRSEVDPNRRDVYTLTPLMLAAREGHSAAVEVGACRPSSPLSSLSSLSLSPLLLSSSPPLSPHPSHLPPSPPPSSHTLLTHTQTLLAACGEGGCLNWTDHLGETALFKVRYPDPDPDPDADPDPTGYPSAVLAMPIYQPVAHLTHLTLILTHPLTTYLYLSTFMTYPLTTYLPHPLTTSDPSDLSKPQASYFGHDKVVRVLLRAPGIEDKRDNRCVLCVCVFV